MSIDQIERKPVSSSLIASVGYDPTQHILEVQFVHEGAVYRYSNVGQEQVDAMMASESIGKWFSQNIKKHPELYPFVRVG